jgi:hypothetical protein
MSVVVEQWREVVLGDGEGNSRWGRDSKEGGREVQVNEMMTAPAAA